MAQWYYGDNGRQVGPVDDQALRGAIAEGRLTPLTLVWREGMSGWQPLAQVTELGLAQAAPVYGPQTALPTSGLAIASLVCGIVGLFACLPFIGIPAVICGHMALNQISRAPAGGRGMAVAGLIMGYLQILGCIGIITALVVGTRF